jgi:hypothetical protein
MPGPSLMVLRRRRKDTSRWGTGNPMLLMSLPLAKRPCRNSPRCAVCSSVEEDSPGINCPRSIYWSAPHPSNGIARHPPLYIASRAHNAPTYIIPIPPHRIVFLLSSCFDASFHGTTCYPRTCLPLVVRQSNFPWLVEL